MTLERARFTWTYGLDPSEAPHVTSTGSPRCERRSDILGIPRTKRRHPTPNALSAIEVGGVSRLA